MSYCRELGEFRASMEALRERLEAVGGEIRLHSKPTVYPDHVPVEAVKVGLGPDGDLYVEVFDEEGGFFDITPDDLPVESLALLLDSVHFQ